MNSRDSRSWFNIIACLCMITIPGYLSATDSNTVSDSELSIQWHDIEHWQSAAGRIEGDYDKASSLHFITIYPQSSVTHVIPQHQFVRLHKMAISAKQHLSIWRGDGNGLFIEERAVKVNDAENILLPHEDNWQLLLENHNSEAVSVAVLTGKHINQYTPPVARRILNPEDRSSNTVFQKNSRERDQFWPVRPDRPLTYLIKGPGQIEIESFVPLSNPEESSPSYIVKASLDQIDWEYWRHEPIVNNKLVHIDDCWNYASRRASYYLNIPDGEHELTLTALRDLQVRLISTDDWLLGGNANFLESKSPFAHNELLAYRSQAQNIMANIIEQSPRRQLGPVIDWAGHPEQLPGYTSRIRNRYSFYRFLPASESDLPTQLPTQLRWYRTRSADLLTSSKDADENIDIARVALEPFTLFTANRSQKYFVPDRDSLTRLRIRLSAVADHDALFSLILIPNSESPESSKTKTTIKLRYIPAHREIPKGDYATERIDLGLDLLNQASIYGPDSYISPEVYTSLPQNVTTLILNQQEGAPVGVQLAYATPNQRSLSDTEFVTFTRNRTATEFRSLLDGESGNHSIMTQLFRESVADVIQRMDVRLAQSISTPVAAHKTDTKTYFREDWRQSLHQLISYKQWAAALELIKPIMQSEDPVQRLDASIFRAELLEKAGEYSLHEAWLKHLAVQNILPDAQRYAVDRLLQLYREEHRWLDLELYAIGLFHSMSSSTDDTKYALELFAESMYHQGDFKLAGKLLLIVEKDNPSDTLLWATYFSQSYALFNEAVSRLIPDSEDYSFWLGLRAIWQKDGEQLYKHWKTLPETDWLNKAQTLISAHNPDSVDNNISDPGGTERKYTTRLQTWWQSLGKMVGPTVWRTFKPSGLTTAGNRQIYSKSMDRYGIRYLATSSIPLIFQVVGPTTIKFDIRSIAPPEHLRTKDNWVELIDNGTSIRVPLNNSGVSRSTSMIGSRDLPGVRQEMSHILSAGFHTITIRPESNAVLIGMNELHDAFNQTYLSWQPAIEMDKSKSSSSYYEEVMIEDDNVVESSNILKRLFTQSSKQHRSGCQFIPEPQTKAIAVIRPEIMPEIAGYSIHKNTLPFNPDNLEDVDLGESSTFWKSAAGHPEIALKKLILLSEAYPDKAEKWLAAGNQIAYRSGANLNLSKLLSRLNRKVEWQQEEQIIASKGLRYIVFSELPAQSQAARVRRSLLPDLFPKSQWINGNSRLGLKFNSLSAHKVKLKLQQALLPGIFSEPATILTRIDQQPLSEVTLEPEGEVETIELSVPQGEQTLTINLKEPKFDQYVSLQTWMQPEDEIKWSVLDQSRKRRYYVSSKEEPVKIFIDSPKWLRIDEYLSGSHLSTYSYQPAKAVVTLSPASGQNERLLRIYSLGNNHLSQTISGSRTPTSIVRPTWPLRKVDEDDWQLQDIQELGEFNEGTWGGYLQFGKEDFTDEEEESSGNNNFVTYGSKYRREFETGRWSSDLFIRNFNDTGFTIGSEQKFEFSPDRLNRDLQLRGSFSKYDAQQHSVSDLWLGDLQADLKYRWQFNRDLRHELGFRAFARYLSDRKLESTDGIDNHVYSKYKRDHQSNWRITDSWRYRHWRDAELMAEGKVTSNEDWRSIDQVSLAGKYKQYWRGFAMQISVRDITYLADDDRDARTHTSYLDLVLRWHRWFKSGNEITARLGWSRNFSQNSSTILLDIGLNHSDGRGSSDYLRSELPFRDLYSHQADTQIFHSQLKAKRQ